MGVRDLLTSVIVPLLIKLELAITSPTMSKCGQRSKIKSLHHPLPLGGVACVSRFCQADYWA